ncbi:MAG: NAD-dependent deacylase [Paludibacteraceae bacterium]|nr:NAD-dependent deacylase [Paludibacteraceae bacterium]
MKKRLVVLTGAGISAESGIRTFRDSDGMWEEYRVEDVATPEGFFRDPELVLNFYNRMRQDLKNHHPNFAHEALAQLENKYDVSIITQNIDDLHERAGSSEVLHLHGELLKARSIDDENLVVSLPSDSMDIALGDKAPDGAQLRPHIVWFGEPVPNIELAIQWVQKADLFLIIGTSLLVYPAAGLVRYVPSGIPIYLIDPKEVKLPVNTSVNVIQKVASEGMREFLKMVDD